jgi:PAS domain S-box-containing protein
MIAFILPAVLISFWLGYDNQKKNLIKNTDRQLHTSATFARALLPDDYHDRIMDSNSVTNTEFYQIVDRYNLLCEELKLEYLWSLLLIDGQPRFTTSTSPDKQVENGLHAGFFELHSNPEFYTEAFETMEPQYRLIEDKWGHIRVVLIPNYDGQGRKYLFGASMKTEVINKLMMRLLRNTLWNLALLLIFAMVISIVISNWISIPILKLVNAAKGITAGNYQKEIDIRGAREINELSEQINTMRQSITEQFESLQKLLKELHEFKLIINDSPTIIFRVRLEPGYPVEFMSENFSKAGYSATDMLSGTVTWDQIVPAEDLDRIATVINDTIDSGNDIFSTEIRIIPPDGTETWYGNWNRIIRDDAGNPTHVHCLITDITEHKKVHERNALYQKRLKALAQDLAHAEDKERRQLAEALHDDLAQMLAALSLKISVLHETTDRPLIDNLMIQVDHLLERILHTCKTLTWQLSPPSLYESNFEAGLERMAADLKKLFDLNVEIQPLDTRLELARNASGLLFRCAKELLVNVAKHSGTNKAFIQINRINGAVQLTVTDHGKGFNRTESYENNTTGFGLFNIRERLMSIDGKISISSSDTGTQVVIEVPMAAFVATPEAPSSEAT